MEFTQIRYEKDGRTVYVTIDRPHARNALNAVAHRELRTAFERFRDDPQAWVAVLTGTGSAFCAGQDLKEAASMVGEGPRRPRPEVWGGITRDLGCDKPIIAAVNGYALGGGFELALACDLVVAADTAVFGLPEPRRGLAATAGGLVRLPRQVPLKRAMAIILTGEPISAVEAAGLGLVNEVVPTAELPSAARRWVNRLLECAPLSLRAAKRIATGLAHLSVEDAMTAQARCLGGLLESADTQEGVEAFVQKRPPIWAGR